MKNARPVKNARPLWGGQNFESCATRLCSGQCAEYFAGRLRDGDAGMIITVRCQWSMVWHQGLSGGTSEKKSLEIFPRGQSSEGQK